MSSSVRRITIDEVLAPDLIRFEVCLLRANAETFFDDAKDWELRSEELVHRRFYKKTLGLTKPWKELAEGQVFLIGAFEPIGDVDEPERFKVVVGKNNLRRIDNLKAFKDRVKRVYSDLLTRR